MYPRGKKPECYADHRTRIPANKINDGKPSNCTSGVFYGPVHNGNKTEGAVLPSSDSNRNLFLDAKNPVGSKVTRVLDLEANSVPAESFVNIEGSHSDPDMSAYNKLLGLASQKGPQNHSLANHNYHESYPVSGSPNYPNKMSDSYHPTMTSSVNSLLASMSNVKRHTHSPSVRSSPIAFETCSPPNLATPVPTHAGHIIHQFVSNGNQRAMFWINLVLVLAILSIGVWIAKSLMQSKEWILQAFISKICFLFAPNVSNILSQFSCSVMTEFAKIIIFVLVQWIFRSDFQLPRLLNMLLLIYAFLLMSVQAADQNVECEIDDWTYFFVAVGSCAAMALLYPLLKNVKSSGLIQDLLKLKVIFQGRNSIILRGKFLGREVAVRKIHKSKFTAEDQNQISRLQEIRHFDGIVPIFYQVDTSFHVLIVMPYYETNFEEFLRSGPSDRQKVQVIAGILRALAHLHKLGITHGDISPRHVFVVKQGESFHVKLSHFRLCFDRMYKVRGDDFTLEWAAPEALDYRPWFTEAGDIYSAGLLALRCWTKVKELRDEEGGLVKFHMDEDVKRVPHAVRALKRMLDPRADWRITARKATMLPIMWRTGTIAHFFVALNRKKNDQSFAEAMHLFHIRNSELDWSTKIYDLPMFQAMKKETYYDTRGGRSFIRFICNVFDHAHSKSVVNKIAGHSAKLDEFVMKHYEPLFYELFELFIETGNTEHYFRRLLNGYLVHYY